MARSVERCSLSEFVDRTTFINQPVLSKVAKPHPGTNAYSDRSLDPPSSHLIESLNFALGNLPAEFYLLFLLTYIISWLVAGIVMSKHTRLPRIPSPKSNNLKELSIISSPDTHDWHGQMNTHYPSESNSMGPKDMEKATETALDWVVSPVLEEDDTDFFNYIL